MVRNYKKLILILAFKLWKRNLTQKTQKELNIENEKLSTQIDYVNENLELIQEENAKLRDENEELR